MGLDVTAYTNIAHYDGSDEEDAIRFYNDPAFKARAPEFDERRGYSANAEHRFRAGAYSSYNRWRNELAQLAGWKSDEHAWNSSEQSGAFWELIHFSDCEGTIGPSVAKKLATDFAEFQAKADQRGEDFRRLYTQFRKAFEIASQGGAVKFH